MKASFLSRLSIMVLLLLGLVCCKDNKPHFVVQGKISDSDSTILYLERRSMNETMTIDSVKLDKNGEYKFEGEALPYNEFYFLKLGNQQINLSVDSIETITINASKATFARNYTVEGSASSSKIKGLMQAQYQMTDKFDELNVQLKNKSIDENQYVEQIQLAIADYKTKAEGVITSDFRDPAAYFAIFQKVGDYLIFDPYNKKDRLLFQAVATAWDQFKPNSPRSAQIRDFTLKAIAESRMEAKNALAFDSIKTNITSSAEYFNLNLPDMQGQNKSVASLKGKAVILDFTAYNTSFSPTHNIVLNTLYNKHKASLEIYQVSFDNDVHIWLNTATNLPWIKVRDDKGLGSPLLAKFNIQNLPTIFLIDKQGNIVKRLLADDDLEKEIKAIL